MFLSRSSYFELRMRSLNERLGVPLSFFHGGWPSNCLQRRAGRRWSGRVDGGKGGKVDRPYRLSSQGFTEQVKDCGRVPLKAQGALVEVVAMPMRWTRISG
jgi:hypothetical protein